MLTFKMLIMRKIYRKILLVCTTTLVLSACTEEFLDKKPIAKETEETFYTNFERLDMTATAAYGILCTRDIDYFYYIPFQSPSDDIEVGGDNLQDWPEWQNIDRLAHTPNESRVFDEPWAYWYKGIRMTNEFLERVDAIKLIDPTLDENLLSQRIGEMRFLRAFYHFLLLQSYGGVPIIEQTLDPESLDIPRNSIAEVLHFIEKELIASVPLLKEKSEVAPEYGRATKGAALALLAKAYLYEASYAENYPGDYRFEGCENTYAQALQYADEVIGSGEYGLVGIQGERFNTWRDPDGAEGDPLTGGFRYIFTQAGDNSDESVWEVQNVADGRDWTLTRGTYMTIYTTIRYYKNPARSQADRVAGGWSFVIPSKYLIAAFGNQDRRETGLNSAETDPTLDPRFQTTIGCGDTLEVNGTIYTKPWDTVQVVDANDGTGWYPMSFSNIPAGTINRKYECSVDEYWSLTNRDNQGPMNVRYIRYADVILMAAEAAYKTNDKAKALDYVNRVRTRARMSGNTNYPQDLTAISFEDIVHERRLELACEPARFPDLVRWGLANDFIDGTTIAALGDGVSLDFVEGKHEFFPIATTEIQLTNNALVQYDGWK